MVHDILFKPFGLVLACGLCALVQPTRATECNLPRQPRTPLDISRQIVTLAGTMSDILMQIRQIKTYIQHREPRTQALNTIHALNLSNIQQLTDAVAESSEALLNHRSHLLELAVYIDECWTTGQINRMCGINTMKTRLGCLADEIYGAICTIEIALVKRRVTYNASRPQVSRYFRSGVNDLTDELHRAYVLMKDGEFLINSLNITYNRFASDFRSRI